MKTILHQIFQQDSLEAVSLQSLQQLTEQHPFFGPGQFLLAKKLHETDPEAFQEQVKTTALYFSDPLWLEHLLTATADEVAIPVLFADGVEPLPAESASVLDQPSHSGAPETAGNQEAPLLKDLLQSGPQTETLELQAYYSIDYFASQGIRLRVEEETDKLGKQLKSFTEWLKTMRRLPQAVSANQLEKINEEAIYQQASGSLEEREIVTETMAEVLVKQQNNQKAIEIYNKLGLQYPSKMAYFAAKIQALKQ